MVISKVAVQQIERHQIVRMDHGKHDLSGIGIDRQWQNLQAFGHFLGDKPECGRVGEDAGQSNRSWEVVRATLCTSPRARALRYSQAM